MLIELDFANVAVDEHVSSINADDRIGSKVSFVSFAEDSTKSTCFETRDERAFRIQSSGAIMAILRRAAGIASILGFCNGGKYSVEENWVMQPNTK